MSLKNEIKYLEDDLQRIVSKLQDLRVKVEVMEAQNERLLKRVSVEDIQNEGIEALSSLYQEGFHICPTHFAQSRGGEECLFCLAFLKGEANS